MAFLCSSKPSYAKLEASIAELEAELEKLRATSQHGGVGLTADVAANADKPGLQGLIAKVSHVAVICENAERSREFYEDFLGARRLNRPNFPNPGFWLWLGNVQLHLIQDPSAARASAARRASESSVTGNVDHTAIEVYDFDAVEAKLRQRKYPFSKNRVPADGGMVIHQIFLQDPDGHWIEVCDCNRMSDFVFGQAHPSVATELATGYRENVDIRTAVLAGIAALAFLPDDNGDKVNALLQRAFDLFAKGDGILETAELASVLKRMGRPASPEEVGALLHEAGKGTSGSLSFDEFLAIMRPRLAAGPSSLTLRQAFAAIDADGSGKISSDELFLMLWGVGQRVNEEQLLTAIRKAEKDGDGMVDMAEFLSLFEALNS